MTEHGLIRLLHDKLKELESSSSISEHEISSRIKSLRKTEDDKEPPIEWLAEAMAFDFMEDYQDVDTGWGTYFGPMMVLNKGDGTAIESPSIKRVNQDIINYWTKRAKEAKNRIFKARYAGLVWDFSKPVLGKSAPFEIGVIYIRSLLDVARTNISEFEVETIKKLERAISLAISFNKKDIVSECRNVIIDYENEIAQDDKLGLWGFSYDLLLDRNNTGVTDDQEVEIIRQMQERLNRLIHPADNNALADPWACEAAAMRLAKYYRSKGRSEEANRILVDLGNVFRKAAEKASPLLASSWLQHVHAIYAQNNMNKEAEEITKAIRSIGPGVNKEMKMVSHSFEIPQEKFDSYINLMTEGGFEPSVQRIVSRFIPKRGDAEKQLFDLSKKAPLQFLFTKQIMDHKGRTVAVIGSLAEDLSGNIVHQIAQDMAFTSFFLEAVLNKLISRYDITGEALTKHVLEAPVFHEEKRELLLKGFSAFIAGDNIVSIHLLIPQAEDAIRNLIEMAGGAVLKVGRGGGFQLKTFDELLRDDIIGQVLGEDMALYMRVLFTDQRGCNLRNNVCHGISPGEMFTRDAADRTVHALLCLAQIEEKREV